MGDGIRGAMRGLAGRAKAAAVQLARAPVRTLQADGVRAPSRAARAHGRRKAG